MRWERRSRRGAVIYARGGGMRRRGGLPMGRAGEGGAVGIVYLLISQLGGGGGTSFGVDSGFPSGVWVRTVYEAGDLDGGDVREAVGASEAVGHASGDPGVCDTFSAEEV
jgi:hypothetical protein